MPDCLQAGIKLEPCIPLQVNALIYILPEFCFIHIRPVMNRDIGIQPHFVPVSSAKQHPARNTECLSGQIPESHFNCAHSATLTSMKTKLFDGLEKHFNITWIFTENTTLQKKGIAYICCIPYLAKTINSLVGIDSYYCVARTIFCQLQHAITHIGNLQIRWI